MERKIGEIFEYKGEWYQCVEEKYCKGCVFRDAKCDDVRKILGSCSVRKRSDKKSVTFKKLEKVGAPYRRWLSPFNNIMVQRYRLYGRNVIMPDEPIMLLEPNYKNSVEIEIKQTKEDMEEKKLNLKPFDIQKAREGKPVCTRDGHKARIICFDRVTNSTNENTRSLVVLITNPNGDEQSWYYTDKGILIGSDEYDNYDLMMLPEKKEGWVNVYKERCYESKEEAIRHIAPGTHYIDTIRVEWEDKE